MSEPPSPAAPSRWRLALAISGCVTGALILTYVVLLAAADLEANGGASRVMFVLIVTAITATVAVDRRCNTAQVRDHIDRRVHEVAERMDRRMSSIANGMIEHGIKLDDITEEIPRIRESVRVVRQRSHVHAPTVYAGAPDKMTAIGSASVVDRDVIDMASRLQRKVEDAD